MSHQWHLLGHAKSPTETLGGDDHCPNSGVDVIIKEVMVTTQPAGGAPSVSVTHESAAASPGEELATDMDVDQSASSPVSPNEDDLLTGATEVGVEVKMATLKVSSTPERQDGSDGGASS